MTNEELIRYGKDYLHDLETACCSISDIHKEFVRESIKSLEQQPSEDCVSRAEVIDELNRLGRNAFKDDTDYDNFFTFVDNMPPVTPTRCIAEVKFSKEDLRKICKERIEIECTHGTCKDCKWWNSENNKSGYCSACKHGHCSGSWDIGIYRKTKADFYCADFERRE